MPGSEISVNAKLRGRSIGLKIDLSSVVGETDDIETKKSKLISTFPETLTVKVPVISNQNLETKNEKNEYLAETNASNNATPCSRSNLIKK